MAVLWKLSGTIALYIFSSLKRSLLNCFIIHYTEEQLNLNGRNDNCCSSVCRANITDFERSVTIPTLEMGKESKKCVTCEVL